ncbi:MAG: GDP-mannose 4,6-dehydratase [Candidatus Aminicenantes bacterium]|jgi:GDP-4-dehydro-6-deoxy-D-mannose reductase
MSKKVLIIGCSGFLGSHLTDAWQKEENIVLSGITEVADFTSTRLRVYHVDIRDRQKVFAAVESIQPDLTLHLAAVANVGFSWKHQHMTYQINFIGSSNILEAISRVSPHSRILLMSSAELYGNCKGKPCKETDVIDSPGNPYSLSKYAMEMVGNLYRRAQHMDIVTMRSFNFTGPGQSDQFVASDFSHQIAEIEKGKREPVIRVGNLSAIRDISDVRDIARYLTVIAKQGENNGIYNLCSGKTYSINDLLDMLLSFSSKEIKVVVDEKKFRPVDIPKLWGDRSLIREKFNLEPQYEIKQTLLDLLNYWRERVT